MMKHEQEQLGLILVFLGIVGLATSYAATYYGLPIGGAAGLTAVMIGFLGFLGVIGGIFVYIWK